MTKKAAEGDREASNRCTSHWWRAYALRSSVDGSEAAGAPPEPEPDRPSVRPAKPARAAAGKS